MQTSKTRQAQHREKKEDRALVVTAVPFLPMEAAAPISLVSTLVSAGDGRQLGGLQHLNGGRSLVPEQRAANCAASFHTVNKIKIYNNNVNKYTGTRKFSSKRDLSKNMILVCGCHSEAHCITIKETIQRAMTFQKP